MSTAFTDEDKAFLRSILNNPGELTGWLAYADWLTERDDPRAEFIRLELKRAHPTTPRDERAAVLAQLKALRSRIDPDWVAIFERPAIENCDARFAFKCPKKWENLRGTDDPRVRECDACEKKVYYCVTLRELGDHLRAGHCVAISAEAAQTVISTETSFSGPTVTMGIPAYIDDPDPEPEPAPTPRRPWWKFW